jgi:hypothetical protein
MTLRLASGRGSPWGLSLAACASFTGGTSQFLDTFAGEAVTLSPYSKANQARIGKDVAGGWPACRQRRMTAPRTGIFAQTSLSIYDQDDPCLLWLNPDPIEPRGGSARVS